MRRPSGATQRVSICPLSGLTDGCSGFDGFLPLGPVLLSPRALPDPSVLRVQTHLNGELMQDGFASSMIFSIPQYVLSSSPALSPCPPSMYPPRCDLDAALATD